MAKVIVGATMSLDGFISGSHGRLDLLYPDLQELRNSDYLKESIRNTGAVVMGRNAFAMADDPDWFAGNFEYQVPMFVLTHEPPNRKPRETNDLTITFVTDGMGSAIRRAKAAAGDKDVTIIGGAHTAQQCISAGLADELHIQFMPVVLTEGLRFFENISSAGIKLEKIKVLELPRGGTHLRFRVLRRQE